MAQEAQAMLKHRSFDHVLQSLAGDTPGGDALFLERISALVHPG